MPQYDSTTQDFIEPPEVQALLTYDGMGKPIAIHLKPKGDRGAELLRDWLRDMFNVVNKGEANA